MNLGGCHVSILSEFEIDSVTANHAINKGLVFSKDKEEKPFGLNYLQTTTDDETAELPAKSNKATAGVKTTNKPGGGTMIDAYVDF